MHGKATSCEKGRRHRLANGPLPARKILAHSTQGDFLCPRTTTCAEQPPPSPCALSSFPSLAAFCPPHVCQSESVVLQVLHSPPASPSIRYRDQRSFQWDIASSAQQARRTYAVASPVRGLTLSPSHPSSSNAVTAAIRRKEGRPDADDSADAALTWRRRRGGRRQRNCSSSAKRSPEMEGAPPPLLPSYELKGRDVAGAVEEEFAPKAGKR